jgi:hypothetical protein
VKAVIDTVAVKYECRAFNTDRLEKWGHGYVKKERLAGGGAVLQQSPGVARVEFSAATRLRGRNTELATVAELNAELTLAMRDAERVAPPRMECDTAELQLVRLDAARDFDIGTEWHDLLIDRLATIARARRHRVYDDFRNGRRWLRAGPGAWSLVAYVKSPPRSTRSTLRIEARAGTRFFESRFASNRGLDMFTIADVTDDRAALLGAALMPHVGWDRTITTLGGLAQRILDAGLKPQESALLWAMLTLPGYTDQLHPSTRRKYERTVALLGVSPVEVVEDDRPSVRFDWSNGTLIRES